MLWAVPVQAQFFESISPIVYQGDTVETALSVLLVSHDVLQMADLGLTLYGLEHGAEEKNWLMKPFVDNPLLMTTIKVGVTLGITYLIKEVFYKDPTSAYLSAILLNAFYMAVVANNITIVINL